MDLVEAARRKQPGVSQKVMSCLAIISSLNQFKNLINSKKGFTSLNIMYLSQSYKQIIPQDMSEIENHKIRAQIEQIIERARYQEEMFLIDSKTAASNILQYLQKENLISTEDAEIRQVR